jgi:hypothetical protein
LTIIGFFFVKVSEVAVEDEEAKSDCKLASRVSSGVAGEEGDGEVTIGTASCISVMEGSMGVYSCVGRGDVDEVYSVVVVGGEGDEMLGRGERGGEEMTG